MYLCREKLEAKGNNFRLFIHTFPSREKLRERQNCGELNAETEQIQNKEKNRFDPSMAISNCFFLHCKAIFLALLLFTLRIAAMNIVTMVFLSSFFLTCLISRALKSKKREAENNLDIICF